MRRFSHAAIGVAQGSVPLFSAFEDGGEMWTGEGPRLVRHPIRFPEPFIDPPVIHLGLGMWDIADGANQRVDLRAEEVTEAGFVIAFRTWGDTQVARVRADWLAIGPVLHDDDWGVL